MYTSLKSWDIPTKGLRTKCLKAFYLFFTDFLKKKRNLTYILFLLYSNSLETAIQKVDYKKLNFSKKPLTLIILEHKIETQQLKISSENLVIS